MSAKIKMKFILMENPLVDYMDPERPLEASSGNDVIFRSGTTDVITYLYVTTRK